MTKIDENAAMLAIETACPGLDYILILGNPETREVVQVSNIEPERQARALRYAVKSMNEFTPEIIPAPKAKLND